MVPKRYEHWYEFAADFLKEAMKGWGLAAVILLGAFALACTLTYQHAGAYMKAATAKMVSEAETQRTVAAAVVRLTEIAEITVDWQHLARSDHERMEQTLGSLDDLLKRDQNERERQTSLLSEIRDAIRNGQ
jgi:hypothetical protein